MRFINKLVFSHRREKSLEAYQAQTTCVMRMQHEIKTLRAIVSLVHLLSYFPDRGFFSVKDVVDNSFQNTAQNNMSLKVSFASIYVFWVYKLSIKCKIRSFQVVILQRTAKINVFYSIPNCTILVLFGGIQGEFGRAMVCILARRG